MRRILHNSRVLITGASSGIGRAIAVALAANGARLILMARREEHLIDVQSEIERKGGQAFLAVGDVTHAADRRQVIAACEFHYGGLDILINNAGVGAFGPFAESEPQRLQRIMDVNFFAPVEMIRLALPCLRKSRGAIVNINSVLGHRAVPNKSEYCASKFAIHGFSDALRAEVVQDGIDVTLISPSTTDSEFFDALIAGKSTPGKQRRGMPPSKVAAATVDAIEKRKPEVVLPLEGKLLILVDRLWPSLANRIVARFG